MTQSTTKEAAVNSLSPLQTELLNRADSIMDAISSAVNKAGNFAAEQIPDIAIQYVTFGRASLSVYTAIGGLLLLLGMWLIVRVAIMNSRAVDSDRWGDWGEKRYWALGVGIVSSVAGVITVLVNMTSLMMVWFAPKIWLITEIAKLAKRAA